MIRCGRFVTSTQNLILLSATCSWVNIYCLPWNNILIQKCHLDHFPTPKPNLNHQKALGSHQKYLNLCSDYYQRSFKFGTTRGWVIINDRVVIFGWTVPLNLQSFLHSFDHNNLETLFNEFRGHIIILCSCFQFISRLINIYLKHFNLFF